MALSTLLALAATLIAPADTVIRAGEKLPDGPAVPLAQVLAAPEKYTKKAVLVDGVIVRSCTKMGCWMQLAPTENDEGMRVDFDEKFFIPLNAKGMKAKTFGVATIKKLTKEEADHLEQEGGMVKRKADGTATEIGFAATGVELRKD